MLEELEHRRVGPVEVLDHQDQRVGGGHGLDEPAPGGEELGPLGLDRVRAGDAEQRASRARSQPRSDGSGSMPATAASSLAAASAEGSDSRMPAWALTISPSAQNVIPSP